MQTNQKVKPGDIVDLLGSWEGDIAHRRVRVQHIGRIPSQKRLVVWCEGVAGCWGMAWVRVVEPAGVPQ